MVQHEKASEYEYTKVPTLEKITENIEKPLKYGYGIRHIQLIIFLICLMVAIIGRAHMGVTIVAMTNTPELSLNITQHLKTNIDTGVLNQSNHNVSGIESQNFLKESIVIDLITNSTGKHQTWSWSKPIQEMVLNAFFLGYMIMMFPMGMVCQRYGGKLPLQIGLFITGVVSIITPWITIWGGWKGVCGCRILQGLSQAGTYPSIQSLLAKWVPEEERATLGNCVHTGLTVGTVIGFQLAGFLGASRWGWPSTFYAVGLLCLSCFVLLTVFGAANPLEHKSISDEEKNYIMSAANKGSNKNLKTPWRAIYTSKHVWGTMITHIGSNITFVFFFNQVPTYIHYILDIDVRNSGLLSSLPYGAAAVTTVLFGWLADYAVNNNIVSKKNSRRISNSVASSGLAICLILTSYTNNPAVAVTCLVVAMSVNMGLNTGWMVNYIDLAPNFTGTLLATGNTLGNVVVIFMPIVVSYVVTDMTNVTQWRTMFFIAAGISVVANAVFVFLMSADAQPFNYPQDEEEIENTEEIKEKKKSIELL